MIDGPRGRAPMWVRIMFALIILVCGGVFGAILGQGWYATTIGLLVASPIALLGFVWPGALGVLCLVIEMFSCGG